MHYTVIMRCIFTTLIALVACLVCTAQNLTLTPTPLPDSTALLFEQQVDNATTVALYQEHSQWLNNNIYFSIRHHGEQHTCLLYTSPSPRDA